MSKDRLVRVGDLIKEVLSENLVRRTKDSDMGFLTITNVKVSPDLRYAVVSFSVFGDEGQQARVQDYLDKSSGYLKGVVSREVRLRNNPDLKFVLDKGISFSMNIESILKEIEAEEGPLDTEEKEDKEE